MMRDNLSSMKLYANVNVSSWEGTRHFEIRYFYITDLIDHGKVKNAMLSNEGHD
jgi:hypothetical protein